MSSPLSTAPYSPWEWTDVIALEILSAQLKAGTTIPKDQFDKQEMVAEAYRLANTFHSFRLHEQHARSLEDRKRRMDMAP